MAELKWNQIDGSAMNQAMSLVNQSNTNLIKATQNLIETPKDMIDLIQEKAKAQMAEEEKLNTQYMINQMNKASSLDEVNALKQAGFGSQEYLNNFNGMYDLEKLNQAQKTWEIDAQKRNVALETLYDSSAEGKQVIGDYRNLITQGKFEEAEKLLGNSKLSVDVKNALALERETVRNRLVTEAKDYATTAISAGQNVQTAQQAVATAEEAYRQELAKFLDPTSNDAQNPAPNTKLYELKQKYLQAQEAYERVSKDNSQYVNILGKYVNASPVDFSSQALKQAVGQNISSGNVSITNKPTTSGNSPIVSFSQAFNPTNTDGISYGGIAKASLETLAGNYSTIPTEIVAGWDTINKIDPNKATTKEFNEISNTLGYMGSYVSGLLQQEGDLPRVVVDNLTQLQSAIQLTKQGNTEGLKQVQSMLNRMNIVKEKLSQTSILDKATLVQLGLSPSTEGMIMINVAKTLNTNQGKPMFIQGDKVENQTQVLRDNTDLTFATHPVKTEEAIRDENTKLDRLLALKEYDQSNWGDLLPFSDNNGLRKAFNDYISKGGHPATFIASLDTVILFSRDYGKSGNSNDAMSGMFRNWWASFSKNDFGSFNGIINRDNLEDGLFNISNTYNKLKEGINNPSNQFMLVLQSNGNTLTEFRKNFEKADWLQYITGQKTATQKTDDVKTGQSLRESLNIALQSDEIKQLQKEIQQLVDRAKVNPKVTVNMTDDEIAKMIAADSSEAIRDIELRKPKNQKIIQNMLAPVIESAVKHNVNINSEEFLQIAQSLQESFGVPVGYLVDEIEKLKSKTK